MTEFTMVPVNTIRFIGVNREKEEQKDGSAYKERLQELAESINQTGILHPLIVRVAPDLGYYQLICGHRRLEAAKSLGMKEVPCQVIAVADEQVESYRLIENLHRKDLSSLDEATMINQLLLRGHSYEQASELLGKSVYYVATRNQLCQAIPEVQKLLELEIPLGHVLEVAKMPADVQKELAREVAEWADNNYDRIPDLKSFNNWLDHNYRANLKTVSWKLDDAELLPKAGSCLVCPKRTGYSQTLFPELAKKDNCLDMTCFNEKVQAMFERNLQKVGEDVLKVSTHYNTKGAIQRYDVEVCKKSDPDAKQAIWVDSPEIGKIFYAKLRQGAGSRAKSAAAKLDPEEQAKLKVQRKKERYEKALARFAEGFTFDLVIVEIMDSVGAGRGAPDELMRYALRVFYRRTWGISGRNLLGHLGVPDAEQYIGKLDSQGLVIFMFQLALCDLLGVSGEGREEVLKILGLKAKDVQAQAKAAYKLSLEMKGAEHAKKAGKDKVHPRKPDEALSEVPDEGGDSPIDEGEEEAD
jgi:ParB/RepB/Spo0J family partition protein